MDYEKKLKDALKDGQTDYEVVRWIESNFPELSESEDERVRKDIMVLVKDWWDRVNKDNISTKEQMIAWLEKQKDTNVLIQEASEKAYTEGMRVERKHWLEKQGESNLIEEIKRRKELYSREKEKAVLFSEKLSLSGRIAVLEELLVFANEKQDEQKPSLDFKASNWYVSKVDGKIHDLTYNPTDKKELKKLTQSVTKISDKVWSEEDERMLHTIIADFKGFIRYNTSTLESHFKECVDWLKSLKDRVQPQNLTVTDEELAQAKKNAYNDALDKIEYHSGEPTFDDGWSGAISYIQKKSVMTRKQQKPKPAWSEEDEDNLRYSELHFKTFLSNTYYDTFCNWLKSLRTRLGGK